MPQFLNIDKASQNVDNTIHWLHIFNRLQLTHFNTLLMSWLNSMVLQSLRRSSYG